MQKICLAGYSGHGFVVAEIINLLHYECIGYFDLKEKEFNPFNLKYLGNEIALDLNEFSKENIHFALGLGDNKIRKLLYMHLKENKILVETLQHPNAIVSNLALINEGSVIMPGVIVNPFAKIGKAVICNTSCVVEHECIIGDFTHIAPGAVLAGNVEIGDETFVGANAVVKQGLLIGKNVIVGAGAVVINNVPDNAIVYGNPAKVKET